MIYLTGYERKIGKAAAEAELRDRTRAVLKKE